MFLLLFNARLIDFREFLAAISTGPSPETVSLRVSEVASCLQGTSDAGEELTE